jgi:hypothetical protein
MSEAKPKQIALRLEPAFHNQIAALAKKEHRSLHSQVILMLQTYFDAHLLRRRLDELEQRTS